MLTIIIIIIVILIIVVVFRDNDGLRQVENTIYCDTKSKSNHFHNDIFLINRSFPPIC